MDLVLYNGLVRTQDPEQPVAEAVAILGGRFVAVGRTSDVRHLATARTTTEDLGGKTVVPGFIDAHSHPSWAGPQHLKQVDCSLGSIAAIQDAIRERARRSAPGDWVLGFKYDDTKTADKRLLTTRDLDAAASNHPVYIQHRGTHTSYVNSMALARAGVTQSTADPPNGRLHRDAAGQLTGRIEEKAQRLFTDLIPSALSDAEWRESIALITRMMARTGITSVHDAYGNARTLRAFADARDAGELALRVYCFIGSDDVAPIVDAGIRTGFGDEWLRVGAMKMTHDGSISECTACLSSPIHGRPPGIVVTSEEEMYRRASKVHPLGWQLAVHANGDLAVDATLRLYERLQREHPRHDARFRVEHCTVVNDGLLRRLRALNCIPNPFSTYVYFHGEKMHQYGSQRLESMFPVRSFLDAGLRPTMTSDYPPGPFEPMMALQSMVTRTDSTGVLWGGRQRVSIEDALRVATVHGAYASFEEDSKGSIQAGKLADLVVLGQDPVTADPFSLIDIPIERTMVGGRWVFEA